jgi:hypothetical protein
VHDRIALETLPAMPASADAAETARRRWPMTMTLA